ncbi:TerC/Alx family metal homeostasis membrane protein [Agarivorans sp. Alg241-V36]|uniref:TerC/Alx family metal homeostasis membrane protein n=1 Tax=Agarivorans sp. Alg241-V36 TaxID=2305992 RepID=UPI0013D129E1|nr:TerC/Alx family metal homeostasis membrane protein [Agarivorans sp. Alg241-V36]
MNSITYFIFALGTLALVLIDVWQTRNGNISIKKAAVWSVFWFALALLFALSIVWCWQWYAPHSHYSPQQAAVAFTTGYLLEKSLSVDNLFVFTVIFAQFKVPAELRPRALLWGVLGALLLRSVMIAVGGQLLESFHWVLYVFAAFLVWTGVKLALPEKHPNNQASSSQLLAKVLPITEQYYAHALWVKLDKQWWFTPMASVICAIAMMDLLFALDSIPAIFAVTQEPFLVLAANVFALLGLRSLFFVLQGMIDKFVYLRPALAVIMMFIGVKMALVGSAWAIPTAVSLAVVLLVMISAVLASVQRNKRLNTSLN